MSRFDARVRHEYLLQRKLRGEQRLQRVCVRESYVQHDVLRRRRLRRGELVRDGSRVSQYVLSGCELRRRDVLQQRELLDGMPQ